ncbi:MAG: hypothetical protein ABR591_14060, partial [Candidatus Velthaea sp.]
MQATNAMPDSVKAALFGRLIDDASLFPPARSSMRHALRAHARNRSSAYAFMQGAFVVPASRLEDLRAERDSDLPLRLSVICDDAAAATRVAPVDGNLSVDALEIPPGAAMPDTAALAARWDGLPLAVWLESPFDAAWSLAPEDIVAEVAAARATAPANIRVGAK